MSGSGRWGCVSLRHFNVREYRSYNYVITDTPDA